jgi:hypothetical protein
LKKTHTKFCKFVLGVRAKSSGVAVRGELGRVLEPSHLMMQSEESREVISIKYGKVLDNFPALF